MAGRELEALIDSITTARVPSTRRSSASPPHAGSERLLAAPPQEPVEAADRYHRERPLAPASAAPLPPNTGSERVRAGAHAAPAPREASPPASATTGTRPVLTPRPSPSANVPTVEPAGPHGVRAPRYTPEDEQRRRDQLAREAAEQARPQAERQRGLRQSQ
jgi:hypothetical protein